MQGKCFTKDDKQILLNFLTTRTDHPGPEDLSLLAKIIKKDEKYKITVRWADVELHSKKIEAKNGIIEWYQRLQINTNLPYK